MTRYSNAVRVRFELYAAAREAAGAAEIEVEAEDGVAVAGAVAALAAARPGLAPILSRCRFAVGDAYVEEARPVAAGESIAVIPPVSGG
jgi:molybdopterin synthase sulfur carrier subunit